MILNTYVWYSVYLYIIILQKIYVIIYLTMYLIIITFDIVYINMKYVLYYTILYDYTV